MRTRLDIALEKVEQRQAEFLARREASWSGAGEGIAFVRTDVGSGNELVRQAALAGVPTNWQPGAFTVRIYGTSVNRPYFPDQSGRRWLLDGSGDVA